MGFPIGKLRKCHKDVENWPGSSKDQDLTPFSASRQLEPSHEMEKWILPN